MAAADVAAVVAAAAAAAATAAAAAAAAAFCTDHAPPSRDSAAAQFPHSAPHSAELIPVTHAVQNVPRHLPPPLPRVTDTRNLKFSRSGCRLSLDLPVTRKSPPTDQGKGKIRDPIFKLGSHWHWRAERVREARAFSAYWTTTIAMPVSGYGTCSEEHTIAAITVSSESYPRIQTEQGVTDCYGK